MSTLEEIARPRLLKQEFERDCKKATLEHLKLVHKYIYRLIYIERIVDFDNDDFWFESLRQTSDILRNNYGKYWFNQKWFIHLHEGVVYASLNADKNRNLIRVSSGTYCEDQL